MQTLHTPEQAARWLRGRVRNTLSVDSRSVAAGDGFIAWPGAAQDGRQYVAPALAQGAAACLVEHEGSERFGFDDERIAAYAGLKAASGPIAAAYYEQPSEQLAVLAVTGTNGKTSTAWWLAQALSEAGKDSGMIGTLGVGRVAGAQAQVQSTGLTTPDPVLLHRTLREFVDAGLVACAIEASSIGIVERRLDGVRIHTAIFTNFTQDHLDYHGSMAAYWQAKAELFDWPGLRAAVVNLDDERGAELAAQLQSRDLDLWTVSLQEDAGARIVARGLRMDAQGMRLHVCEGEQSLELSVRAVGTYNASNLLGVIAALRSLGVSLAAAVQACPGLQPPPGRMEFFGSSAEPLVVVDYAHTPDAIEKVLQALRPLAVERGGHLVCVFGCGGDRDPVKRPLMGAAAARFADGVVITSDNPRNEAPEAIIEQIRAGVPAASSKSAVQVVVDRAEAIAQTIAQAAVQDVVLVAGKGHEDYQEVAGVKKPFSDRMQVIEALRARAARGAQRTEVRA